MQNLYKITFSFILALLATVSCALAQNNSGKITGKITSHDNQPVAGVTVSIKELSRTANTDVNGLYTFSNVKPGTFTLIVTYIGAKSETQSVAVSAGQTTVVTFTLQESASELKDVVITHSRTINQKPVAIGKMNIAPMDLPQSIVTIGQDVIEQQQAVRLSEVLKNANGVYLYSARGGAQETFAARGYNFSSTNTFKNGFRSNSGAMPEVTSLERVEILKGSAALLYGNVAPGGILNLVTKKPKFEQGGSITMTTGSYNLYKPVIDIYGPISSKFAYRVDGTYEDAGSFRNNVSTRRYYVNPSLMYKINDRTNIVVESDYLFNDFVPDFGIGQTDNAIATNVPRNAYLGASWSTGNTQQASGTATVNHQFNSSWQLSGGIAYQYYQRNSQSTERMSPTSNGDWFRPLGRTRSWENYATGQVNLTGQFGTGKLKHNILIGSDAERYDNTNYSYSANNQYLDQNYQLKSINYDQSNIFNPGKYALRSDIPVMNALSQTLTPTNRYGIYVNDLISLSAKVKVLAGVRWSYQYAAPVKTTSYYSAGKPYNADGTVSYAVNGKADNAFSPRLGLVYKPFENTSLFASYSNSFIVNTGTDNNVDATQRQTLKPSIVDQYEVGVKNEFFNGSLSVNATAFRITNNNLAQTAPFLTDGTTPNTNTNIKVLSGQTQSDGVELDVAGHPLKGLDLLAGYSYNYARYTKTPNVALGNVVGQPLLNTPKHTANTSVFYTLQKTNLKGLKAGVSVFYLGKRYAGFNNVYGQASRLVAVSGFTTVDASLGYTLRNISLIGKVSNLGDVLNYNVHENYSVNPIPPRQFIATAAYRF